jgi:hypothetical protein
MFMKTSAQSSVAVTEPSLPKGGGAMQGVSATLGKVGPTGMASMSLSLPISSGRGYAPSMALNYSGGGGNGIFGVGWGLSQSSIMRRVSHGIPQYTGDDQFVGPDGEVLEPERDTGGKIVTTSASAYASLSLGDTYVVTRYYSRIEGGFNRVEHWVGAIAGNDFWLIHGSDGQLHCLGKTTAAQIADPATPTHIAVWLTEESVSPNGQHIYYRYRSENDSNIDMSGNEAERDHQTNCYPVEVSYGNVTPSADLFLFDKTGPDSQSWLFSLVFDYGERGVDSQTPPSYTVATGTTWPVRKDPFSHYSYGFEVRNYRLCHQVLMFHHFPDELGEPDTLVARLLLEYDENPVLSRLEGAQRLAYETDATVQQLPPGEFTYSPFEFTASATQWQPFNTFPGLNAGQPYQLVDLHGEGIAGLLYRAGNLWYYRAPMRADSGGDDVAYDSWQPLPTIPAMQSQQMGLMDIDSDGKLDWLVTQPGLAGFFSMNPDGTWSGFTPFDSLPVEFFHPEAKLVDLVGAGMADLALIGPKSVRLYANHRTGFASGVDIGQSNTLPIAGRDEREMIAFSDMLGSGQQHLVRIRHDSVTVWPNLGRGRFGTSFQLAALSLDEVSFNPERVYLADLDGSGAADLIYVDSDAIHIWFNQSGNALDGPYDLPLPSGIRFDRLCQLSVADVQGLGMASLVLTQSYMSTQHWYYTFAHDKPYLLNGTNNNTGMNTAVTYRSSAQEWLDEKKDNAAAVCQLPFPIHVVSAVTTTDEITGNVLSQSYLYRSGVYDGREQEFRGFGYVEALDTNQDASATGDAIAFAPPLQSKSWYHTGREQDETNLYGQPYVDSDAYTVNPTRLTQFDSSKAQDVDLANVDDTTRYWLYRSLKGSALRSEVYGLDDDENASVPYSIGVSRYQARQVQPAAASSAPVVMPSSLEQTGYTYERIATDPQISQQVTLTLDEFGAPRWSVGVNYPRRVQSDKSPYPDTLPPTSWNSSYDDQQKVLRLNEQRVSVYHLTEPEGWRLGLPNQQRGNALNYEAGQVPAGGLNFENLTGSGSLLADTATRIYGGQSVVVYQTADKMPDFLALVDHAETAELDGTCLAAYDDILDLSTLSSMLGDAGYLLIPTVLAVTGATEDPVWGIQHGFVTYLNCDAFYCPSAQQKTLLTGASTISYDAHYCTMTSIQDAIGNETTFEYDYRFLQPVRSIDINANTHEMQIDALGRSLAITFYGTENSQAVGFGTIADNPVAFDLTVSQAIDSAGASTQQLATICAYDLFSWMGQVSLENLSNNPAKAQKYWQRLLNARFITEQGHIRAVGRRWLQNNLGLPDLPKTVRKTLATTARMPVHSTTLVADCYPGDTTQQQQVRVSVSFSDGLGRQLQSCAKAEAGMAWQLGDDGELVVDADGKLVEVNADPRWRVSGKVEYDNKGQAVRNYQPYFADKWQYATDSSMRTNGYSDTNYYDPIGREVRVETALNYLRRQSYYPWFVVSEDENDTVAEPSVS